VLYSYIPQYSSTVVKKLDNAGCVMIGKLNCDAWAHGSSGENSDYGPTKNPWNTKYVPGGSSSGSGASVASNFALLSTGTDTCGSVRLPANYCGLVGLKPTYGAVSRYGIVAMASSLDCVGHYCHTVEDAKTVFNITKGIDKKDSNIDDAFIKSKNVNEITLGIPKEFFVEGLSDEIAKDIDEVIKVYKSMGVKIKEVSIPHMKYGISVYYIIQPAEVSSNLGRYDGIRYGNVRGAFGDEAKRRIMLGTYVLSAGYYDAYYKKAMEVRAKIIQEVDDVFGHVDAIIAPVAPTPAFKLGAKTDDPLEMYLTDIYAATANLSGIPALAIPTGKNKDNLPLGYQIMGPRFSENTLFELGKAYQKEVSWKPKAAID
jgi:aspartyl-tRNA(Asn)/glutamyl-tRNA(Gln) amidotransferase subunit A